MHDSFKDLMKITDESSEDFFHRLVDEMPGGFFIYRADDSEEILEINKAALKIFDCESYEEFKQLTGNTFKGLVHPDDLERVEESIAYQIEHSENNLDYVEYRIRQKNGSTRWVTDYGRFAHLNSAGDVYYVFIADNTERMKKRMADLENINEELTKASARESQYRKAILYDAVFFFEVSLTEDRFITAVTQPKEGQMFDFLDSSSVSDKLGFSDFIDFSSKRIEQNHPGEYKSFFDRDRLLKCCENGELEQTYDFRATDALGRKRTLHYIILLGNDDNGNVSALVLAKDVTDQMERKKLLQLSLRQAQAASIAKSAFLSNMSHDIRTPLNAILGFADLIRLHLNESAKTDEYLEKIKLSGKQLLTIVNEALEVTRMESGKVVLAETECHLADLLAETEKTVIPQMKAKSIDFSVDSSRIAHFSVYADTVRIKEILCQLLDNAAKYTEHNGKVTLAAAEESVSGGYGRYRFIVTDNGIGISEEFKEHLFEPFAREKNTTKSGVLGSGLGMAVVKNLVDLMDGRIEVESRSGVGSKFTVTIILKLLEKDISAAPQTDFEYSAKGKRLLLVDDNEINSEIAQALLTEEGFLVETASDGDLAVEAVKNSEHGYFDFVLMDIQMPRMNGYEAAREIRALKDRELASIPIIALSANTYAEDRKRSIDAGMNAHAPKPINMVQLQGIIAEVLERRGKI
ncbi:MAG: response regulator [Bacteroides sp.]|nr:response regulator [Bacteroides sp.]